MKGRLLALALIGAAPLPGLAAQDAKPAIDQASEGVLVEACNRLRDAEHFSVRIDTSYDRVREDGSKIQLSRRDRVALARPDRLQIDVIDDQGEHAIFYSGKLLSQVLPDRGIYALTAAPGNIDETLDKTREETGISLPLADILRNQPCAAFEKAIETGTYQGLHYVEGDWRHHLLLTTDQASFQVWVSGRGEPTIDKLVVYYPETTGVPQFAARFSDWNFAPAFDDGSFRFEPSGDQQQVAFPIKVNGG